MKNRVTQIALAPVLLAQGVAVRRRALILPEAAGPRDGREGKGPELRVLVVGDSSGAGVGVAEQKDALSGQIVAGLARDFTVDWRLVAQTGATTKSTLTTLQTTPAGSFDVAVVALGVNDAARLIGARRWKRQTQNIINCLMEKFKVSDVVLSPVPPMGIFPALPQPLRTVLGRHSAALDAAQETLVAAHPRLHRVNLDLPQDPKLMAQDGYHPGAEVYAVWGGAMAAKIRSIMAARDES